MIPLHCPYCQNVTCYPIGEAAHLMITQYCLECGVCDGVLEIEPKICLEQVLYLWRN